MRDGCAQGCAELGFPIIADPTREIITQLGMIGARALCAPLAQLDTDSQRSGCADPEERNAKGLSMPARAVRNP